MYQFLLSQGDYCLAEPTAFNKNGKQYKAYFRAVDLEAPKLIIFKDKKQIGTLPLAETTFASKREGFRGIIDLPEESVLVQVSPLNKANLYGVTVSVQSHSPPVPIAIALQQVSGEASCVL